MYGMQFCVGTPLESLHRVGMSAMTFLDTPPVAVVVVDPNSTAALLARELHERGPLTG